MIKIENAEVVGWEHAIRGMRNPMNSWDKSDSGYCTYDCADCQYDGSEICRFAHERAFIIGYNDLDLMKRLVSAGTDHRKFMRMIVVYVDVTAPMYWWKEFDTYKVGTVRNSCSTMHKITDKEFTLDDFSTEHLIDSVYEYEECCVWYNDEYSNSATEVLEFLVNALNIYRNLFVKTKDKKYWWQIIQLLPASYNQRATLMLNYEVLANIYHSRKSHRLDEWRDFCAWIESLPYSELITGGENNGI